MAPHYFVEAPLAFSLWDQDLTIEDINHLNVHGVYPLAVSRKLEEHYDLASVNPPLGFWDQDLIHYQKQISIQDREKFGVLYQAIKELELDSEHVITLPTLNRFQWGVYGQHVPLQLALHVIFFLASHECFPRLSVRQCFERLNGTGMENNKVRPVLLDQGILTQEHSQNPWRDLSTDEREEQRMIIKFFNKASDEQEDLSVILKLFYEAFAERFAPLMK